MNLLRCQPLGEDVSDLRLSGNKLDLKMSLSDPLTSKMIDYLDMLATIVQNKIHSKIHGRDVITKESNVNMY